MRSLRDQCSYHQCRLGRVGRRLIDYKHTHVRCKEAALTSILCVLQIDLSMSTAPPFTSQPAIPVLQLTTIPALTLGWRSTEHVGLNQGVCTLRRPDCLSTRPPRPCRLSPTLCFVSVFHHSALLRRHNLLSHLLGIDTTRLAARACHLG